LPAAQALQALWPALEYAPAAQALQALWPALESVPAAQEMQVLAVVAPAVGEYFPALQSTHSLFVNSSSLAARYLPGAHAVHEQGEPPHFEAHEKQHLVHTPSATHHPA
jgi:hypothetical protein